MDKPLFDPQTKQLLLEKYIVEMPSYQAIMEDRIVEPHEIQEQHKRVITLLKRLEETPIEIQTLVSEILCELTVLAAVQSIYHQQSKL